MTRRSPSGSRRNPRPSAGLGPRLSPQALVLPGFLAAAIVLGGASAAGPIPNLLLQLLAIGLAFMVVIRPGHRQFSASEHFLLWIGLAFLAIGLLQLFPLPPSLWSALPDRGGVVREFHLLNAPLPWLPLSLNPAGTIASLLGLTIVAGTFALVHKASDANLAGLAWTIVALAAVAVLVGFLQLASGGHSPLYLYSITNRDQPVGFFANSNHLATLELAAMPFLAALATRSGSRDDQVQGNATNYVLLTAFAALLLLGLVTNGSLAGLGLLLPTLIGCFSLVRGGGRSRRIALIGLAVAMVLVVGFFILALNSPILSGFAQTQISAAPTSRIGFIRHSLAAIGAYFPVGSGLGSFIAVFPSFEDPSNVESVFVNHAHNDYLEIILELGLPGMILIAVFLGWWVWRTLSIWRNRESGALLRAATVASGVVLAHSLVDYPLRTAAIAAIFTACCAIMARPGRTPPPPPVVKDDLPPARHLSA